MPTSTKRLPPPGETLPTVRGDSVALSRKGISITNTDDLLKFSSTVVQSGLAGALCEGAKLSNEEKRARVFLAVQAGMEVGLPPWQSIMNSYVIHGRHSFWGRAIPAIIQKSGLLEEWEETSSGSLEDGTYTVTCRCKRSDTKQERSESFSVEDAKRQKYYSKAKGGWSPLWEKETYQSVPKQMFGWRARHACMGLLFADVLAGIAVKEDLEERPPPETPEYRDITGDTGLPTPEEMPTEEGVIEPGPNEAAEELMRKTNASRNDDTGETVMDPPDEHAQTLAEQPNEGTAKNVEDEVRQLLKEARTSSDVDSAMACLEQNYLVLTHPVLSQLRDLGAQRYNDLA